VIPEHRLTPNAIEHACYLAHIFSPSTPEQAERQMAIYRAVELGDLYRCMSAVQASCTIGKRGLATVEWRQWAKTWIAQCNQLILSTLDIERGKAA
jgi:hypothetical protein